MTQHPDHTADGLDLTGYDQAQRNRHQSELASRVLWDWGAPNAGATEIQCLLDGRYVRL